MSIDYCTRLERGKETRPSPSVVDSLARAVQLEEDEHQHLRSLAARTARGTREPRAAPSRTVRPGVTLLLESLRPYPARVLSRTTDLLASNPGGLRLLPGMEEWPAKERNIARYVFLHPEVGDLTLGFQSMALEGTPGHRLVAYCAEPDTPEYDALVLLDMLGSQPSSPATVRDDPTAFPR